MTDAQVALIDGLSAVAASYDALFVDVWGVIHDGRRPFHAAAEACRRFRAERGPVVLVSNSPRTAARIPAQFREIGVATDFFDAIATSGDATRAELARRAPGPAFKLGPARDDHLYEGVDLEFVPLEEAAFVSCSGLFDDETETPADYADLLDAAAARDLEMVCANPDVQFRRGDRVLYAAGALAQEYGRRGGRVVLCGKPHAPIYALAREAVSRARPAGAPPRILAIGDGPDTDLAGAQNEGLDALFIAAGLHADELGDFTADAAAAFLDRVQRPARYAAASLAW